MLRKLMSTTDDFAITILRLLFGVVFFAHGAQKALGWFGGFGIACNMVVAVAMIHIHYGFFANWFGNQKGEGFEYHILAFAIAVIIIIKGSGALSLDRALSKS